MKMSVRILIERHVKEGKEGELIELLAELRTELISQPGYISGEILQNVEDKSTIFALSTWASLLDWKSWEGEPERLKTESRIEPLLTETPKLTMATAL
ncbi:MAG TPA: antibiotic biosynthesis monooxygenase [Dehalococcoidia bacterium]|nr:antibiotic biosynthesis monooxygenase [Dehalococcoidia bacterium]